MKITLNVYEKLKKINNEIEFSSDFIIGYPGETDKDFEHTLNFRKKIKFINSFHLYIQSKTRNKSFKT